ncbi:MAG TPA: DUF1579 domain-containing protein [Ideonella sp.]|uniref:DUF1579 domain-containing protein n=1 Tax=Ideonella sp. TaxID=1929293 RepID=UPI002C2A01B3|nr:DUF1579 domain-containing protein [Ideonella sp.]HSI47511.1 DUF1579 domain-containing protein [Ideonella sp.]
MPHVSTAQDFDFFHGQWQVQHRRLRERLAGCVDWETFSGACEVRPLLGGAGNVDDNLLHLPAGSYRAATLRSFNAETAQWAIWWLDQRQPHRLDPPMLGSFDAEGVGLFYADDQFNGQPIRVRFRWTGTQGDAPGWEQAFSTDGGQSWEVNWVMRFERTERAAG